MEKILPVKRLVPTTRPEPAVPVPPGDDQVVRLVIFCRSRQDTLQASHAAFPACLLRPPPLRPQISSGRQHPGRASTGFDTPCSRSTAFGEVDITTVRVRGRRRALHRRKLSGRRVVDQRPVSGVPARLGTNRGMMNLRPRRIYRATRPALLKRVRGRGWPGLPGSQRSHLPL